MTSNVGVAQEGDISTGETSNNNKHMTSILPGLSTTTSRPDGGCKYEDFMSAPGFNEIVVGIGFIMIIENSLLIAVIARNRKLHNNTNILVASLAVTDVLMGFQCFTAGLTGLSVGVRPGLGTLQADLHLYDLSQLSINLALVGVSLLHVSALAVDRYLYILWPFQYNRRVTRPRLLAVTAAIWSLALIYVVLPLTLLHGPEYRRSCILRSLPAGFGYVPMCCVYVLCLAIVFYCTLRLVQLARKHRLGRLKKQTEALNSKQTCLATGGKPKDSPSTPSTAQPNNIPVVNGDRNILNVRSLSDTHDIATPSLINSYVEVGASDRKYLDSPSRNVKTEHKNVKYDHFSNTKDENVHKSNIIQNMSTHDQTLQADLTRTKPHSLIDIVTFTGKKSKGLPNIRQPHVRVTNGNILHLPHISREGDTDDEVFDGNISHLSHISIVSVQDITVPMKDTTGHLSSPSNLSNKLQIQSSLELKKTKQEIKRLFNKANLKIVKFVVVVFGTFLMCTFPAVLLLSIVKIFDAGFLDDNELAFDALHFIISTNSCMNFLTITYMNRDFRRALIKLMCPCRTKSQTERISASH